MIPETLGERKSGLHCDQPKLSYMAVRKKFNVRPFYFSCSYVFILMDKVGGLELHIKFALISGY